MVNDEDRAKYPMIMLRHADDCLAKGNHDCDLSHPQASINHIQYECRCSFLSRSETGQVSVSSAIILIVVLIIVLAILRHYGLI